MLFRSGGRLELPAALGSAAPSAAAVPRVVGRREFDGLLRREGRDARVVITRDDKDVRGSLRVDVAERDAVVGLGDEIGDYMIFANFFTITDEQAKYDIAYRLMDLTFGFEDPYAIFNSCAIQGIQCQLALQPGTGYVPVGPVYDLPLPFHAEHDKMEEHREYDDHKKHKADVLQE